MDIEVVNSRNVSRIVIYAPDGALQPVKAMVPGLQKLMEESGLKVGELFERKAKGKV